ncbi:hypothetical protein [Candidatus Methylomirabilis sp.]|uniref:hypothetical protein n=1 Tax=Candidatus Methylomirabilis sp. TaxID=2032687 RepID=UPI0030766992
MPGYHLIEARMLTPSHQDGIEPHPNRKGFLDYMRELREETFPFPPGYRFRIEGLEDLLLAAGDRLQEVEGFIHATLVRRAGDLDAVMGTPVQIIFRQRLQLADDFWVEAGVNRHLSLRRIFGTPIRQQGPNGTEFFFTGFNLT